LLQRRNDRCQLRNASRPEDIQGGLLSVTCQYSEECVVIRI
jgi:hypothetical protein